MFRIAICEDNLEYIVKIESMVASFPSGHLVKSYFDGRELLLDIENNNLLCDILLLDISLGNVSGIDIAKRVNRLLPTCQIIYVTSYLQFATDVYESEHVYFVLKSEMSDKLLPALNKAANKLEALSTDGVWIHQKSGKRFIGLKELIYCERKNRVTLLFCDFYCIQTRDPIDIIYNQLNLHYFFCRCHNSYIVNLKHVVDFQKTHFILYDQSIIPISRHYYNAVKLRFARYLSDRI